MAGANDICKTTLALKHTYQQATPTRTISNAPETISKLATLTSQLGAVETLNATPTLQRINHDISGLTNTIKTEITEPVQGNSAVGARLYQHLSHHMQTLDQVTRIFGCADVATLPPGPTRSATSAATKPRLVTAVKSAMSNSVFWLAIIVALMGLVTGIFFKCRRREARKMCRTSMLIVYGDQCTVTHIVDMAQGGMKIEASEKVIEQKWADLYFCGHKVRGKMVWRNACYAGIKFKSRVSRETLEDVIRKSNKPLDQSGLETNATPCFSLGCHTNCPRHLPTTFSNKGDAG
ncbi:hypothetical protein [Shimia sp.]|uniref:hypothetical protein n=1 Tax=Shimia sp. TaxID=1954381 RepID=UPI003298C972